MEIDGRDRLYIRLGKKKRDRRLAAYLAADIARGVNVSSLAKELLYAYYTHAPLPTSAGPAIQEPQAEEREAKLSAKLKSISFGGLG